MFSFLSKGEKAMGLGFEEPGFFSFPRVNEI
jgi:hypothetical protein